jgi:hypothetical protein
VAASNFLRVCFERGRYADWAAAIAAVGDEGGHGIRRYDATIAEEALRPRETAQGKVPTGLTVGAGGLAR